jgi:hypothetical protein
MTAHACETLMRLIRSVRSASASSSSSIAATAASFAATGITASGHPNSERNVSVSGALPNSTAPPATPSKKRSPTSCWAPLSATSSECATSTMK